MHSCQNITLFDDGDRKIQSNPVAELQGRPQAITVLTKMYYLDIVIYLWFYLFTFDYSFEVSMLYNIMLISLFLLRDMILFTGSQRRHLWFSSLILLALLSSLNLEYLSKLKKMKVWNYHCAKGIKDYFISHAAWYLVVYRIRISMEAMKHSRKKNIHKIQTTQENCKPLNRPKGHIKCIITGDDQDQVGRGKEEKQRWSTAYSKGIMVFCAERTERRSVNHCAVAHSQESVNHCAVAHSQQCN